jgi:F-type H+-transporting ATPase subunit delta
MPDDRLIQTAAGAAAEVTEAAREHLAAARESGDLSRVAGELLDMSGVLTRELRLRRALADPSLPAEVKHGLLGALLGGRAHEVTIKLLDLVVERRLRPVHMVDLVERLGAQALFTLAESEGTLDDVEDELFRFARLVAREPRLRAALADATLPTDRKLALVDDLLGGKVRPATLRLVRHVLLAERGRVLERALEELAGLAADARGRLIAEVVTAYPLDVQRTERLRETLTRLKSRPVALQVTVDSSIMGGVIVRIGAEQYDGSARRQLQNLRDRLG